jgi:hypothetical protein
MIAVLAIYLRDIPKHGHDCSCLSYVDDSLNIAKAILKIHPDIDDRAALRLVRRCEAETVELLNRPAVWPRSSGWQQPCFAGAD